MTDFTPIAHTQQISNVSPAPKCRLTSDQLYALYERFWRMYYDYAEAGCSWDNYYPYLLLANRLLAFSIRRKREEMA